MDGDGQGTAAPKPLASIVRLLKRLQPALAANTGQPHPANNSPGGFAINWQSLLNYIEPHLYGYTPMYKAPRTIQPIFRSQTYGSKTKAWTAHEDKAVSGLLGDLPQSFRALPVACPHCRNTAPASDYGGAWYEARCGSRARTFKPTVRALVRSLYGSGNYDQPLFLY
ncbi:hypothetical protein B0T26DRAFT_746196 [Lasiosphaeria miniovina]|uniref:Uncharacterized protein n=1 Tax=Lasiosphaeria miniovina TaxID=1954250 RepID=A0AA40BHC7_9PEZI|nr:uncharacterized protein B0T26DRAFT_746196 [Lasiosphaeria miniovina]KAK0734259.1 hypothetical protein B0T26DRAFT_746196 [Lasiosphaeria miniovina]